jgi:hypothetical protein
MYFKQFLTEVSTGDIIALNKAVENKTIPFDARREEVVYWFEQRGYTPIGEGAFATALQSKDHFIVKVASGDKAFAKYTNMTRKGKKQKRMGQIPFFPRIIAQKTVSEWVIVYFIERLVQLRDVTAEELIKHHTKKDAGIFIFLAAGFIEAHDSDEVEKVLHVALTLDPSLKFPAWPEHPGWGDNERTDQWHADRRALRRTLEKIADEQYDNHPFIEAVVLIKRLGGGDNPLDLHSGNIMIRMPTYEVVLSDPVALVHASAL